MSIRNEHKAGPRNVAGHITATDIEAPPLYRADLFKQAKADDLGFREIARDTGLALATIQAAFNGDAKKIDSLFILARYFGIDWLQLFDIDSRLVFDAGRLAAIAE